MVGQSDSSESININNILRNYQKTLLFIFIIQPVPRTAL